MVSPWQERFGLGLNGPSQPAVAESVHPNLVVKIIVKEPLFKGQKYYSIKLPGI